MTIDEAIEKYRKLSNADNTCCKEEAQQLAKWLEELKTCRENSYNYMRLIYGEGYKKGIDDFVKQLYKMGEYKDFDFEDVFRTAEQLKKGEGA